jgi:hypothetical protein
VSNAGPSRRYVDPARNEMKEYEGSMNHGDGTQVDRENVIVASDESDDEDNGMIPGSLVHGSLFARESRECCVSASLLRGRD